MNANQQYWQYVGNANAERLRRERLEWLERQGRELPEGMEWGPETSDDDPYGEQDDEYWKEEE